MPAKKKLRRKIGKPAYIITAEIIEKVESLAARGLTMEQIASCLGIHVGTLYEKKSQYSDFDEAIKRGRDKGISIVANALFENAKAGNTVAGIFYLKCRAHWNDAIGDKDSKDTFKEALQEVKDIAKRCMKET